MGRFTDFFVFFDTCFFVGFAIIWQKDFLSYAYEMVYESECDRLKHWLDIYCNCRDALRRLRDNKYQMSSLD